MSPAVDSHCHVFPQAVVDAIRAGDFPAPITIETIDGAAWVVHAEGYRYPLEPEFHDVDALLAGLPARGAEAGIVSPAPPLFGYALADDDQVAAARLVNDGTAATIAAAGGRLGGLATIPLGASPDAAVAELERAVGELGLLGAEVGTHAGERWLDDPELRPVLAAAERLGAVLFVHPYYTGPKPGLEDMYLTNLVGNPLDTGLCAARLILSGTLDLFPQLRVMLAHGGGYLPYQAGRLGHGNAVRPELGRCELQPTDYLRRFAYDTIVFSPHALKFLVDLVGADRVVYGSDEPFDMRGPSASAQLRRAGLSREERAAVVGGTASKYLGFEPTVEATR
jgi:aminocarboxymuconate-semialdehyde decarboxylase